MQNVFSVFKNLIFCCTLSALVFDTPATKSTSFCRPFILRLLVQDLFWNRAFCLRAREYVFLSTFYIAIGPGLILEQSVLLRERERERERKTRCIIQLGFKTLNNTTPRKLQFLTRALRQKAERIQKHYYSSHTCR